MSTLTFLMLWTVGWIQPANVIPSPHLMVANAVCVLIGGALFMVGGWLIASRPMRGIPDAGFSERLLRVAVVLALITASLFGLMFWFASRYGFVSWMNTWSLYVAYLAVAFLADRTCAHLIRLKRESQHQGVALLTLARVFVWAAVASMISMRELLSSTFIRSPEVWLLVSRVRRILSSLAIPSMALACWLAHRAIRGEWKNRFLLPSDVLAHDQPDRR